MFGAYLRATITVGIAVLSAAILQMVLNFFLPLIGSDGEYLYDIFGGVSDYALFIMLLGIAAGIVARSVVESDAGVR